MQGVGFDRNEPPRGERECEGRLRPSPDWAFRGLSCCGSGFASGIDARRVETRYAARREPRKPARSVSGGDARAACQARDNAGSGAELPVPAAAEEAVTARRNVMPRGPCGHAW